MGRHAPPIATPSSALGVAGRRLAALVLAAAAGGCGDNLYDPFVSLVRVSSISPFPGGCAGGQQGTNFGSVEVEPWVAVDPTNPAHLVGTWQQDRWSNGGANGIGVAVTLDGGATWSTDTPRIGRCAGAAAGADYQRASDPWVTVAADGTVFLAALAFDSMSARNAMLASRSTDGGATWSDPAVLIADDDPDVFNDKGSITADPADPGRVYAVWDRLTGQTHPDQPIGTGPTWFARTTAGAWEPARAIFDPGLDAQTIGNVIAVRPDGTLVDVFDLITQTSNHTPSNMLAVIRSEDHGLTWSAATVVAPMRGVGVQDPQSHVFIRSGTDLPQVAADRTSGALYIVWEDAPAGDSIDAVMLVSSLDGGVTWSAPVAVNGARGAPAFTPSVAVAADGTVGVTYFDLRNARPGDGSLRVTPWLATSRDRGATWSDEALSSPFDLHPALLQGAFFLGDYQGLVTVGNAFVPFFAAAVADQDDRTDVFVHLPP
ncbi:MAG TPA: sialidase family protein [Kofleriaceae bacterium]|nr:sialidase family protein [Kofleriaceae bacterium]